MTRSRGLSRFLLSWAPAVLWGGVIFFLSSLSDLSAVRGLGINDKVAHFLLFFVFGVTLAWAARDIGRTGFHLLVVFLGILYAVTDEWHQSFVPMRQPSVGDLLADLTGILVGYLIARGLIRAWQASKDHQH